MNQRLLITGSCGFILSNFIRKLVFDKAPYDITSLDRVNAQSVNSVYWNKSHSFHIADICDPHILNTIFQLTQPEIVIHGAAQTGVDWSMWDASSFARSNVQGTQNVINACVAHKVKRLIYLSDDAVYGDLTNEQAPPWTESSLTSPCSPYAATKLAGELLIKAAAATHGLDYNIVRISDTYGPHQHSEYLIPLTIKCLLENTAVPVYGQGQQIRSWTHVFDVGSGLLTVLQHAPANQTYNLSTSHEIPNIVVVQKIHTLLEKQLSDTSVHYSPQTGHDFRRASNADKLLALGWKPSFKFKDGIEKTVQWYVSNQWILRSKST